MAVIWIYQAYYEKDRDKSKRETEKELGLSLLSRGLKERFHIEESHGLAILKGPHGKPYLADHPEIHFNISHCSGYVVCAIGETEMGVDAELVRDFSGSILKKVVTENEKRQLDGIRPELRQEGFFRFWTLKESYLKAVGCGIRIPLTEVEFLLKPDGNVESSALGYSFWQEKIDEKYILSVCGADGEDMELVW